MTVTMIDSIESPPTTGNPIPQAILSAPAVGAYIAGNSWPTYGPYAAARPDLVKSGRLVSITLTAGARARCLDIEAGGATAGQAPAWFRFRADTSDGKPILYSFASNVQTVINTMASAGISRDRYLIWSAHFNYVPHICAPNVCGYPLADGTQWTNKVVGNCDGSLMGDHCFPAAPIPKPPEGTMAIAVGQNKDGLLEVFVELSGGEVKHIKQDPSTPLQWWEKNGQPNWLSLGNPAQ